MSEERETFTAPCRYCGQQVVLMMPKGATQEEIQEAANNTCKCQEGEAARLRAFNKNSADAWIDEKYKDEEGMRDLLHECTDAITWETVDQITVKRSDILDAFTQKITSISIKQNISGQIVINQNTSFKRKDKF